MSKEIISQIRHLQRQGSKFSLELSSGRIIQVYDPLSIATAESGTMQAGMIGVLSGGVFELVSAEHVVAVSAGIHPEETARFEKLKADTLKIVNEAVKEESK